MSKPRVFLSSTFYDLVQVRQDLEGFIIGLGFEAVLHETGGVPYSNKELLEDSCYREISGIDIFVGIIGGKFGSQSAHSPWSISQLEIKTALELNKPVYLFIKRDVQHDYDIYKKNKDRANEITWNSSDNIKVLEFIDNVRALPQNNPTFQFDVARDIVTVLREQWAGLFQRLLHDQEQRPLTRLIQDITTTSNTLKDLVDYLVEMRSRGDDVVHQILLNNHPAMMALQQALHVKFRIFFSTHEELEFMLQAMAYTPVSEDAWDRPDYEEWLSKERQGKQQVLRVYTDLFEKGVLKILTESEWEPEFITQKEYASFPDDLPF